MYSVTIIFMYELYLRCFCTAVTMDTVLVVAVLIKENKEKRLSCKHKTKGNVIFFKNTPWNLNSHDEIVTNVFWRNRGIYLIERKTPTDK